MPNQISTSVDTQGIERGNRPWGYYIVVEDTPTFKVKRIFVEQGKRLSYQSHNHRTEVWTIVQGAGLVTRDGIEEEVFRGDIVVIPAQMKHRIKALEGGQCLEFTEVQIGDYFGEDDIIRYQDDYARE